MIRKMSIGSRIFLLKTNRWSNVTEKESLSALHSILSSFGADAIRFFSGTAKISKLVLWENIWSYTVWMYSELLKQTDIKTRVEKDIEMLLEDEVWLNIETRSPFKRFIGEKSVPESMNPYKRVTCCFILPNRWPGEVRILSEQKTVEIDLIGEPGLSSLVFLWSDKRRQSFSFFLSTVYHLLTKTKRTNEIGML
ncbi:hypothetical protein RCO48_01325 [Peribacillus frigoritolerans]|nr:hypothetical protein [Peribacillus frigoritolerans]